MPYAVSPKSLVQQLTKSGGRCTLLVVIVLTTGVMARADSVPKEAEWHEFKGTWTSVGSRQILSLGGERRASIADYSGSLMLYGASRPALGFRAQAIVLNDSATGLLGRAVWTDARGNQIYSELRGEPDSNNIIATFVGGSGRFQGATGTYKFSWRFQLEAEDGTLQGQSMDLSGKVRLVPGAGGNRP